MAPNEGMSLEQLRRECVRVGTYISDSHRRKANEGLREPLSRLQVRVEALTPEQATPDVRSQLEAELEGLTSQVRS